MAALKKKKTVSNKKKAKTTFKKVKKKPVKPKLKKKSRPLDLRRALHNPVMSPTPGSYWESEAVFNPGAVMDGGRIHLFYRALGPDGISRIGYASSIDGVNFDYRHPHPVYIPEKAAETAKHHPYTSPARLTYNRELYLSGGGWGGCEDPRAVKIEGRIYLTFNMFNGWHSMRVAFTSIGEEDLANKKWYWSKFAYLSRPGDRQKNWILFPEKIRGKFALFHNLDKGDSARVHIAYLDELDMRKTPSQEEAPDPHTLPDHVVGWHNRTRSAAAPPIKTPEGWLLFYHAMDRDDPGRYKLGALLLDLEDPTKVLYRSSYPILEPDEWYENDWKPGIIYASGAVVKGDKLFIYYGGGDKHIGIAYTNLSDFIKKLVNNEHAVFSKRSALVA
ncbi:MAG: hypothetical protein HYT69_01455 [Candidatus Zambryskibacteria bacterium]|nr:hypothetical protein [Candidatus Zambryskibacteria bacterium]